MIRTSNAFSVLQATAGIVSLAIIFWSLGLPSFQFAEAANVTTFSDTLSTSEPSVVSDHTIVFTTPTGVANAETIVIDFTNGPFVDGSVDYTDIDVSVEGTGDLTLEASCTTQQASAAFAADVLTITLCSGNGASIAANGTTTIEIGLNATSEVAGDQQITNPAAGSYEITMTAGASDSGATRVAIVPTVLVTASVDTIFTFSVGAVAGGVAVNGETTTGPTTATTIPFGTLENGTASTAAQLLTVSTNAANGFSVTVQADSQLESTTGADIDGFVDGSYTTTPTAWASPSATLGTESTYGHWGLTSDDSGLTTAFGASEFVSASTTPVEVFSNNGPSNGTGVGVGTTSVAYNVEISALQEAADDYTATLTYVATPVF